MVARMEQTAIKVFFSTSDITRHYLESKLYFFKTILTIQLVSSKTDTNAVPLTVGGAVGTIVVIIIGAVIAAFVLR